MGGEKGDRAACGEMGDRGGGLLRVGEGGGGVSPKAKGPLRLPEAEGEVSGCLSRLGPIP